MKTYQSFFKRRHLNINNLKHSDNVFNSGNTFTFFDLPISNELNRFLYSFKNDFVLNIQLDNSQVWVYETYPNRALRIGYWSTCYVKHKKISIMCDGVNVEHSNDLIHVTITTKMDKIKFTLKDDKLFEIDGFNIINEFKKALIQDNSFD